MKIVIEKELCQPTDAWTIPGPYYHVVRVDEETGEREVLKTFEGDIKEAARFAERQVDFNALEVAYQENPNAFKSTMSFSNTTKDVKSLELETYEGTVTGASNQFTTICYDDCTNNRQLFYAKPGDYKYGDKVSIVVIKMTDIEKWKEK